MLKKIAALLTAADNRGGGGDEIDQVLQMIETAVKADTWLVTLTRHELDTLITVLKFDLAVAQRNGDLSKDLKGRAARISELEEL